MRKISIVGLFFLFLATKTFSNEIDSVKKWAWGSTIGWINHYTSDSLKVYSSHLEGYAYSENIGWIKFGNYTGGDDYTYQNSSTTDYGVNNDGLGNLSGYAWSSVAGWINFAPQNESVSINPLSGEFSGFAYSENIGWISFSGQAESFYRYGVFTDWMQEQKYTLTYISETGGSIIGDKWQLINQGENGSPVGAIPNTGYYFEQWSDGRTDNPRIDNNIFEDLIITAYFEENPVSVDDFAHGIKINKELEFIAYPVPQPVGCNYIDFSFKAESNIEFSFIIYTIYGTKILETSPEMSMDFLKKETSRFETENFSEGLYIAVLRTKNIHTGEIRSAMQRFIINR